jgi:hypothetical protein
MPSGNRPLPQKYFRSSFDNLEVRSSILVQVYSPKWQRSVVGQVINPEREKTGILTHNKKIGPQGATDMPHLEGLSGGCPNISFPSYLN